MKNIKSIISILIVLIIVVIACLIIMNRNNQDLNELENTMDTNSINSLFENNSIVQNNDEKIENDNNNNNDNSETQQIVYSDTRIKLCESEQYHLTLQSCVKTYYDYVLSKNAKAVYNLLDSEYIKSKNITESNIFNNIENIEEETYFFASTIYEKEITNGCEYKYYVYGRAYSSEFKDLGELYFNINLDIGNSTFKLIPYGKTKEEEYNKIIKDLISNDDGKISEAIGATKESIAKNDYNKFTLKGVKGLNKMVIQNYFKYYKFLLINDSKKAYSFLDEEYKKSKFSNYNNFENFCKTKSDEILDAIILSQKIEYLNDCKKYTIKDNYGNTYIFKVKAVNDFSVSLS